MCPDLDVVAMANDRMIVHEDTVAALFKDIFVVDGIVRLSKEGSAVGRFQLDSV